ncbi:MAG TPA: DMT family transporter [Methylomusa anaerophila]|uniref:Putative amino-acid metabolite efflux pump n=1 Tax=Methylomusa anaerophila TaxID=1930071 RepID=A0A348ANI7_9FIRM|nr:DMT family transporter [Methylomusa anaerophila]BBB92635.1 putative amino-acid metabolite efflux pump [Methylomusa anaerophila]HML87512.1 DMT family transporter [Methylomusa anaerophila]
MYQSYVMGLVAIFCTAVVWGLSFISIKITVAVIPPMTLALLRFIIASAILVLVLKKVEPATRLAKRDVPFIALSGVLGVTIFYSFQNIGIKLTTASAASMIIASIPIFTIVGEFLVFKTKLSLIKICSVILSIVGVYLIVATPQQASSENLVGILFMLGATVSWVIYMLITRPLSEKYSQLAVVTHQVIFGTLALIPFSFFETWQWEAVNYPIILHLLYLGIICSALANYLYVYAMNILGVSNVSLFVNFIPVVSVIGGFTILQEPVSTMQMLGGAIILLSVYLANRKIEKSEEEVNTTLAK